MGRRTKPSKSKAKANGPRAGKLPKDDGARVRDLETRVAEALKREAESLERERAKDRALTEALAQQTATSEILQVISNSPTAVQPVFDAIVRCAARLCDAVVAGVFRTDGRMIHHPANYGPNPEALAKVRDRFPVPVDRTNTVGEAILTRSVVHVPDVEVSLTSEFTRETARMLGFRSVIAVPMLHEGQPIGVINVCRGEPGGFADAEVELLKTFADQAVIAIENVRLFNETKKALEQQTATAEILRVISSSPTDLQPVFDTIVRNAVELCGAIYGTVHRFDGALIHLAAYHNFTPEQIEERRRMYPRLLANFPGEAAEVIRTGAVFRVADVETEIDLSAVAPGWLAHQRARSVRSALIVPMLRQGEVIGTIDVSHREVGAFTDAHVALLQSFADQAVIAIENVRLFTELQEKNQALTQAHVQVTEALDQQTATAEVLKVIGRSTFDLQSVLATLIENATRLCNAQRGLIVQRDGDSYRAVAFYNVAPDLAESIKKNPVTRDEAASGRGSIAARVAFERRTIHVADVQADPAYKYGLSVDPVRTNLGVPIVRGDDILGVIIVYKLEVQPFTDKQIELVETFADQAVIAIENARLLTELQARTQELTRSVGELRALGEVGQAISSTLDLHTVLSMIVAHATQLSGTDAGVIYEYDEYREVFLPRANAHLEADIVETMLATPVRRGEGATGRLAEAQEPIQLPDILEAPAESRVRGALVRAGYRALLAIPLVRDDHLLGGLTVIRKARGAFAPEAIELLQTFATQSSLAIQNARLFLEIADKSRQLEAASQHKSEFLANMSHELRTPLNAIIGFSEVLTERMFGELNEKQDEYLKDIYASGEHLLSLINDILDLSKIEAGRMELEPTNFDLPSAIDNALTLVRERAGRRGITLGREIDQRVGTIRGDERKVKQVVLNLLSNAIKFTPEGGRIDVHAAVNEGLVEVSVADTGVGIAPEDQEAVFEEFRQVGTADKKVEGTGLGLALSRKFIELHGGRIWVKSQVGTGSTFTFTIPVHREPNDRGGAAPTLNP